MKHQHLNPAIVRISDLILVCEDGNLVVVKRLGVDGGWLVDIAGAVNESL